MGNIVTRLKINLIFLVFWFLLTLNFEIWNIIIGIIVTIIANIVSRGVLYDKNGFKFKSIELITVIKYSLNLVLEIYKSSFSYLIRIIKKDCEPFILEMELEVTDPLIVSIIANSITLTPGTITVDVQGNKLKILTLKKCASYEACEEVVRQEIKDKFESFFIEKG